MARFRHYVTRLTAFGSSYASNEEWSTGFYFGLADADTPDPSQASADAFLAAWQTFFTSTDAHIWTGCKTEGVRIAKLNKEDGKVVPAYNFYAYYGVPIGGANGGAPLPAQTSLVASLYARPNKNLGGKGRMYLPCINVAVNTDGTISPTEQNDVADALQALFNGLNDNASVPGELINASKGRGLQLLDDMPVNRYVQDVKVGNVYDTQRRRRNQLNETYVAREITLA